MTHVVTSNCCDCKFTDCVLVCPVDCFYQTETQLVIDPVECIDCSACVAECPVEAIYAEDEIPDSESVYLELNAAMSMELQNSGQEPVVDQQEPLPTAEARRTVLGF